MTEATATRPTNTRGALAFIVGFVCGWAARSTVDSPHALGMKAFILAHDAKVRLSRWMAMEQERISDMLAEARARFDAPLADAVSEPMAEPDSSLAVREDE
jgi:hypothetical protein